MPFKVHTSPQVETEILEGVDQVEVSEDFIYIKRCLVPEIRSALENNANLQEEVSLCRNLLWKKHGQHGIPPLHPEEQEKTCQKAGAIKLF